MKVDSVEVGLGESRLGPVPPPGPTSSEDGVYIYVYMYMSVSETRATIHRNCFQKCFVVQANPWHDF